jgi:hypothetical protein
MKRTTISLFLVLVSLFGYSDTIPKVLNEVSLEVNPLDTLQFDQIVTCNINFDSLNHTVSNDWRKAYKREDELSARFVSYKSIVDTSFYGSILELFSDTATYGDNYSDCFEPRFVLQFKLKEKEVFRILVCEDCGHLESTVPLPAAHLKYYDSEITDNGKKAIWRRYLKGFSKQGEVKINQLCKSLNLGYCQDKGVRREELEGCWADSREENTDSSGISIFRRCHLKSFPVSRFRFKMELKEGGICSWLYLAPNDAHQMKEGTWTYNKVTHLLRIFNVDAEVVKSFNLSGAGENILKFKN